MVERHDRRLGVLVEGNDSGAVADVIQMLRRAANLNGQENASIHAYPRLADLPVAGQQMELFRDFARSADDETANSELTEGFLQRLNHSFVAVAIADAETD